jgi:hypothetical protein
MNNFAKIIQDFCSSKLSPLETVLPLHILGTQQRPQERPLSNAQLIALLPPRADAEVLLQHYTERISWMFHVIHTPTVMAQSECIYTALSDQRMPSLSHLALMCAMLASSNYFSTPAPNLHSKAENSNDLSGKWTSLALIALSESDYLNNPTIESIQAMIILTHALSNPRGAALWSGIIVNLGHCMRLHQLDSRKNQTHRVNSETDAVDLEIKRRVWWHIASSDW